MTGTASVPLGALASVIRGVTFKKNDAVALGGTGMVPVLRAGNIGDQLDIDNDLIWLPRNLVSDDQLLRANDIAMCASSGSPRVVGKSAQLTKSWGGSVGAFCLIIRPDPSCCCPEYIACFLRSSTFRTWAKTSPGANIKNIRKRELEKYSIPLPPLDEQRRIVGILNRATKIERLRAQAGERLREFIPALFIKMFGDPAANPMEWPKKQLGQLCIQTKQCSPGNQPAKKFRYVDISGIDSVVKRISKCRLIVGSEAPTRARKVIQTNDVLVSTVRPNLNAVAIVPSNLNGEIASTGFCVLRANQDRIDPAYLFLCATSEYFINTLVSKARGANYPSVSDKDIKDIRISLPPLHLQKRFAKLFRSAQVAAARMEIGNRATIVLNSSLMSRLLGDYA